MDRNTVVVIGASRDRNKFGNKAVRAYQTRGWEIYPVNPNETEIEGLKSYRSLAEIPRPVMRATVYLPPNVVLTILEQIRDLDADEVFFNPGSDSPEIIQKAHALGIKAVSACSIVDIGESPSRYTA